jgi:hypothetical protein
MGGGRRLERREHLHTEASDAGTPVAAMQQQLQSQEALRLHKTAEMHNEHPWLEHRLWGGANGA